MFSIVFGALCVALFFVLSLAACRDKKLTKLELGMSLVACVVGEVSGVYIMTLAVVFG